MAVGAAGPLFLTREQAAEACNVSLDTIRRAIGKGTLRAKRTGDNGGGKYLISPDALQAWFEELPDA
ncbi:MAG TPA: excisionase family DNA-binding protein [Aeromicrobium sp.]|nr:excisionase family DNA-binding protein [Aeromicrobium sp.]